MCMYHIMSIPAITIHLKLGLLIAEPRDRPAFAREAGEGCRAGAQRAKAGYAACELRLGKPRGSPHQKRLASSRVVTPRNLQISSARFVEIEPPFSHRRFRGPI